MSKNSLAKELSLSTESGIEPSLKKSNSVQSGRSMIEMLGVLAIIGVLSVGGIAGYSKAMMKFKINKTVDQISTIVTNTRTLFSSQKNYSGLGSYYHEDYTLMKKAHLLPDEVYTGSGASDVENPFGGSLRLFYSYKTADANNKAFVIHLDSVPEEACMELATMDWGSNSSSGFIGIAVNYGFASGVYVNCAGSSTYKYACPNGSEVSIPMPVSIAASTCSGNNNEIALKYY